MDEFISVNMLILDETLNSGCALQSKNDQREYGKQISYSIPFQITAVENF